MNPPITYSKIQLSPEEKTILSLLAVEGCTQDQIALKLKRSPETVKRRISGIRKMIGVDSLYQVIAIAVARGWIPAPRSGKRIE